MHLLVSALAVLGLSCFVRAIPVDVYPTGAGEVHASALDSSIVRPNEDHRGRDGADSEVRGDARFGRRREETLPKTVHLKQPLKAIERRAQTETAFFDAGGDGFRLLKGVRFTNLAAAYYPVKSPIRPGKYMSFRIWADVIIDRIMVVSDDVGEGVVILRYAKPRSREASVYIGLDHTGGSSLSCLVEFRTAGANGTAWLYEEDYPSPQAPPPAPLLDGRSEEPSSREESPFHHTSAADPIEELDGREHGLDATEPNIERNQSRVSFEEREQKPALKALEPLRESSLAKRDGWRLIGSSGIVASPGQATALSSPVEQGKVYAVTVKSNFLLGEIRVVSPELEERLVRRIEPSALTSFFYVGAPPVGATRLSFQASFRRAGTAALFLLYERDEETDFARGLAEASEE